jgi:hypothetical protein
MIVKHSALKKTFWLSEKDLAYLGGSQTDLKSEDMKIAE